MENKRVLTKQEIDMAERRGNSTVPPYGSGAAEHRSAENQAICEAQDAKTLREVGKWLEGKEEIVPCLDAHISRGFLITPQDIEALKQGQMPE